MAKRVEGFDEAILSHAKKEFLEKGYESASLRTIAANAGVSTSAIYTRFGNKEGLYRALVSPAAEKLLSYMQTYLSDFRQLAPETQVRERTDYSDRGCQGFLDILYDNFDDFKLMVTSSTNDLYRSYLEKIAQLDEACTVAFLKVSHNPAYEGGRLSEGLIHMVSSGFYAGLFELAVQNISREEGEKYIRELVLFYQSGWDSYL